MHSHSRGGANHDIVVPNVPGEGVASLSFHTLQSGSYHLASGSWSKHISFWTFDYSSGAQAKLQTTRDAPVLCTDFTPDGSFVAAGGCDNMLKLWDLAANKQIQLGAHQAPIKEVYCISNDGNMFVTGGWDSCVKYWDRRQQKEVAHVPLNDKVFAMDANESMVVVGGGKTVYAFDLRQPTTPKTIPVKSTNAELHQIRSVALFNQNLGCAVGGIEGRVFLHYFNEPVIDPSTNSQMRDSKGNALASYPFKCHRETESRGISNLYSINSIRFYPDAKSHTFVTCGSDGTMVTWDKAEKQRLKQFNKGDCAVISSRFSKDGKFLAYAHSYDWSRGYHHPDRLKAPSIYIHELMVDEIKVKR